MSVQIALVNKRNRTFWTWNCSWFVWNVRLQLNCCQVQIYLEWHYLHTCIKVTFYLVIGTVSLSGRRVIFMLCVSSTLNSFTQLSFFCSNPPPPFPSGTVDGGFTVLYNTFRSAVTCFISYSIYQANINIVRVTKSAHACRKLNLCTCLS